MLGSEMFVRKWNVRTYKSTISYQAISETTVAGVRNGTRVQAGAPFAFIFCLENNV